MPGNSNLKIVCFYLALVILSCPRPGMQNERPDLKLTFLKLKSRFSMLVFFVFVFNPENHGYARYANGKTE